MLDTMRFLLFFLGFGSASAVFLNLASPVAADQFLLRNGGVVEGTLLNTDENPRRTYRIRLDKGGEVSLKAIAVRKHLEPTPEQRKYKELLARMPSDSAQLHWKMAEQCEQWSLLRERKFHLEQTIRLEPNHAQARRALNHRQRPDGSWGELSEIMAEQGKVRRNGRWVSEQQAEMLDAAEAFKQAEIEWKKKSRLWRRWLSKGNSGRVFAELEGIDGAPDAASLDTLIDLFRSPKCDPDTAAELRELLAAVLARSSSTTALDALVEAAMTGSRDLQMECLRQLEQQGGSQYAGRFLPFLRNEHNQLVRRAGDALGILGSEECILPLIAALRTTHTRLVGGAGDGRINLRNGGLSAGQTKPKKVTETKTNREVLSALVKLTSQDFRYDQDQWIRWYARRSVPPNLDLRRDE